jgi:hypothetical protein
MNRCKFALTMGGSLAMGLAGVVNADDAGLDAKVAELQKEVATLKGQQNEAWLNQRRSEEIKGLIQEVLSDADTRASLMAEGAVAGHDGKNFFLSSVDGSNRLNFWGQIQFRYILNFENDNDDDKEDQGFQTRRAKLGFNGHVTAGRKWDYEIIIALDRENGNAFFEDVKFGTQLTDALRIDAGKFKLPFLREELTSSKRLLAAERSAVAEFFTLNRAEQVQLSFKSDMIKAAVSLNDGANSEFSDIGADTTEIAVTGRVDIKLNGDWNQASDTTSWSGEPLAIFLGGAIHYETGDSPNGGFANYLAWTVDGSLETAGFGLFASVTGGHVNPDVGSNLNFYGFVVQGSYNIKDTWEPFARFEYLMEDDDSSNADAIILTFGLNYYIKGHDAKVTVDLLWVVSVDEDETFNANPFGAEAVGAGTGLGFSSGDSHNEDNVIIRIQFQLLF